MNFWLYLIFSSIKYFYDAILYSYNVEECLKRKKEAYYFQIQI
jgi:hypothetical protein